MGSLWVGHRTGSKWHTSPISLPVTVLFPPPHLKGLARLGSLNFRGWSAFRLSYISSVTALAALSPRRTEDRIGFRALIDHSSANWCCISSMSPLYISSMSPLYSALGSSINSTINASSAPPLHNSEAVRPLSILMGTSITSGQV